jgi:hypothetical protein
MNERIKELAEQSEEYAFDELTKLQGPVEMNISKRVFDQSFREKFAELIVKECIGCCEQVISDPVPKSVDTWLNGGSQCIDQIKQHFGVE